MFVGSICGMGGGDNGCSSGLLCLLDQFVEWVEVIMDVAVGC